MDFDRLTFWLRDKEGNTVAMVAENISVEPLFLRADQSFKPADFQEATVTYFQVTKDETIWTWPISVETQEAYTTFVASLNPVEAQEKKATT